MRSSSGTRKHRRYKGEAHSYAIQLNMGTRTSVYRKCIETLLLDSDRLAGLTPGAPRVLVENKFYHPAALACTGSFLGVEKEWTCLRQQMGSATDVAKRATCARAWLDAYREIRAFERIGSLLRKMLEQAAVATSATHSVEARYGTRARGCMLQGRGPLLSGVHQVQHSCIQVSSRK